MSDILEEAIQEHDPVAVFGLFSGGHDSLCATSIAAKHPRFTAAVHINTGIGVEETREFVRETCEREGWPLLEYKREGHGQTYEELAIRFGFPGPAGHPFMYRRLKERQIERLIREHKQERKDRIVLVTGMRREESVRRMAHGDLAPDSSGYRRRGAQVWTSPLRDWSKIDVNAYLEAESLPRNAVVDMIHMSGECLCGSYAKPEEMQELEQWFPDTAARLHELERKVEAAGHLRCVWGHKGDDVNEQQQRLFPILPLCQSCESTRAA
jgi:3'-phosphoadenosine 5'-phosphosulfate sulfotransferase (PAPS reductase)/FAD synthetase